MSNTIEIRVPDIGDFAEVPVIEVLVKPGDTIAKNDSLVVLESEKASMEVPAEAAGTVESVNVKVGDKVSQGTPLLTVTVADGAAPPKAVDARASDPGSPSTPLRVTGGDASATGGDASATGGDASAPGPKAPTESRVTPSPSTSLGAGSVEGRPAVAEAADKRDGIVHASPAIRRFARELGVELSAVNGTGPHGRVTRDDVQNFVKSALEGGGAAASGAPAFAGLPPWPNVDFARYGEIERKPLSRLKRISGPNLHRNWLQIPHITNYDEADVTGLEAFRNEINAEQKKHDGVKLTMLAFLIKASVAALTRFPEFNASLAGDELVYKHYYNIGFAADTPSGLVVPVLKDAHAKGLLEVARETAELAAKARDGKLGPTDMQGGTFTISSIGGIGGTAFTQIVNAPEVAILGAVRAATKPVWNGSEFLPRLMLPISVSYDHRVIDGAGAARFLTYFAGLLSDFRRVLL